MTECMNAEVRDALPDYLNGMLDAARTEKVRAHVAACDECARELELLRVVSASALLAPTMDVARIANAIPTPTRHGFMIHRGGEQGTQSLPASSVVPMRARPGIWSRPSVRIAAGLAIVLAGGLSLLVGRDVLRPESQVGQSKPIAVATSPAASPVTAPVTPMRAASSGEAQPEEVASAAPVGLSLTGDLQELSDEHIATLMNEMDRMDGLPSAEPESVEPALVNADSSGQNL